MQQLETSKEIVEAEQRYKRMGKGRTVAQSRKVYRLVNTDVFYVESESSNNTYYFCKIKFGILEYCSCPDHSMRIGQMRCKHIWACELAIRLGTLRDTDRLPTETKVRKVAVSATVVPTTKWSYKDDDYSF
ncbi:MAG: hypothetical protein ACR2F1_15665 [Nitrososphaeraceae archaeon]